MPAWGSRTASSLNPLQRAFLPAALGGDASHHQPHPAISMRGLGPKAGQAPCVRSSDSVKQHCLQHSRVQGPKLLLLRRTGSVGFGSLMVSCTHLPATLQNNHIYTSGATGTNAAVIRGALRAEKPDLLTVVLPQSRSKQPADSQELLEQVGLCKLGYCMLTGTGGQQSAECRLPCGACVIPKCCVPLPLVFVQRQPVRAPA